MGNNGSVTREIRHQYIPDANAPTVVVTYKPDGDDSFTYSDKHKAYTNDPSKLAGVPGPRPPVNDLMVDDVPTVRDIDFNKLDVADAVATLLPDQTSEITKIRVLWKWLTSQNILGTIYKLTEEFDEVEYQLQKLKKTGSDGNTYAALFALLCAYAKIPCIIIRGYVKGSLYTIGQPVTDRHMAEWNAVFVDGSWRLLDPFWGACCKTPDEETVSDTSSWYLFTEPRQFLYSHYPETAKWQLIDQPITLQEFTHQPLLTDRFFRLGMQDLVTPSFNTVSAKDGEVNILIPLDSEKATYQEFLCVLKQLVNGEWIETEPEHNFNQHDFMYLKRDGEMVTLSIYLRFPAEGTYKVEIIGKEVNESATELNEFDWIAVYRVEVRNLQKQVYLFPVKPTIGWGPGEKLTARGIEAISHQEGLIMFFPDDQLQMVFKVRGDSRYRNLRLRGKLHMKNGKFLPETSQVTDEDWYSKETDRSIKFTVRLNIAADYMLQICAEVDGREVGSVCNYLIVCVGEIKDNVLEEIKKLKPRLKSAMNSKHLYDLRCLTSQTKSKALHRHALMRELYNEAIDVLRSLEAREDILRKLKALKIPDVVREIRGYNQVPDVKVEHVMKATFLLLGVQERDLQTWETIRQRLLAKDASEGLAGQIQRLKDTMNDFISDRRNRQAITRVDSLLKGIVPEDVERISLAVFSLFEVIKLIVEEYKTANSAVARQSSTGTEGDAPFSPTSPEVGGTMEEESVFAELAEASRSEGLMKAETISPEPNDNYSDPTNADLHNIGTGDVSITDEPGAEVHIMPARDGQRDTTVTPQSEMIPLSPRVEL